MRSIFDAIDRLERLIDAETQALSACQPLDYREFNDRKSQILLELTRAARNLGDAELDATAASRLREVRAKLADNQAALATHLKAAKAISSLIAGAIRDRESDGTYSNRSLYREAETW